MAVAVEGALGNGKAGARGLGREGMVKVCKREARYGLAEGSCSQPCQAKSIAVNKASRSRTYDDDASRRKEAKARSCVAWSISYTGCPTS